MIFPSRVYAPPHQDGDDSPSKGHENARWRGGDAETHERKRYEKADHPGLRISKTDMI